MARVSLTNRRPPTTTAPRPPQEDAPFTYRGQTVPLPGSQPPPGSSPPPGGSFTYRGQTVPLPGQMPPPGTTPPASSFTYRGQTVPIPGQTPPPPPPPSGAPFTYRGQTPAPPSPPPSSGDTRAWPRNQPTFVDYERDYWAPDRREVLLRELTRDYWAPDREAQLQRYRTMSEAELWPHGRPGQSSSTPPPSGGSGSDFDLSAFQNRWQELIQRYPGTVDGLRRLVEENPDLGIEIVGGGRGDIRLPNGQIVDVIYAAGEGGRGWQWLTDAGGSGDSGAAGGSSVPPFEGQFSNPSTARLEQFVNQRFQQLLQPAYSGPELEILRTQALDPIERDRQASRARALENISGRGLTLESGISQDLLNQVDQGFDRQRAGAQNQLAYQQIAEQRSRQQEAQALLSLLDDLPRRAFQDSLAALGMGPTPNSLFGQAMGLYQIGQQQQSQGAEWYRMLGSLLPYLMGGR